MMPSCDQIGVPIHFHSSTTSGSASLMSLRILPRVFPRQSPSSAILFEMSSDADWPWLAPDFFMLSSSKFRTKGYIEFRRAGEAFGHGPSLGDDGCVWPAGSVEPPSAPTPRRRDQAFRVDRPQLIQGDEPRSALETTWHAPGIGAAG